MLKISFVAKDDTKREAKRIASQDHSIVIDMRIVGAVFTAILVLVLSVSNFSLRNEKKRMQLASEASISGLEKDNEEKNQKITSLEEQLKAVSSDYSLSKSKVKELETDKGPAMLEDGIYDETVSRYRFDKISFMSFDKPINELKCQEDWLTVNHNVSLTETENSSSAFEWVENPKELQGCYLLVEKEEEWGYIPLDFNVKYTTSYREFESWKNTYVVFSHEVPTFAALSVGQTHEYFGWKEDYGMMNNIIYIGDSAAYSRYPSLQESQEEAESYHDDVEIRLWEWE